MFDKARYFPTLKVSPSEIAALRHLPDADKNQLTAIIRLRRWRAANQFADVVKQIDNAIGPERPCIVDVCPVDQNKCDAHTFLESLLREDQGYVGWVEYISQHPRFIPMLLQGGSDENVAAQAQAFVSLGRACALRLARSDGWNIGTLAALAKLDFRGLPLLVVLDLGQTDRHADVTLLAAGLAGLIKRCLEVLLTADVTFTLNGSSFPVDFAGIDRERAEIEIKERQVFSILAQSLNGKARLIYGDGASVFAGERGIARAGPPRIDLPKSGKWIYHRKQNGTYQDAAKAVVGDTAWDDELVIWGADRIRDASNGILEKFSSPQAWTGVRIHLHIHQQTNFGDDPAKINNTDEEWKD